MLKVHKRHILSIYLLIKEILANKLTKNLLYYKFKYF